MILLRKSPNEFGNKFQHYITPEQSVESSNIILDLESTKKTLMIEDRKMVESRWMGRISLMIELWCFLKETSSNSLY